MTRLLPRRPAAALALLAALFAAGCAETVMDRRTQGQIIGGATGAALGSLFGAGSGKVAATGAGAVIGAIAGGELAERR
jgi:uncharacterized protein YcfJ